MVTRAISSSAPRFFAAVEPPKPAEYVSVTFVDQSNNQYTVEKAKVGLSLFEIAFQNDIPMPLAYSCNGGGMHPDLYGKGPECDWCHVFLPNEFLPLCQPKTEGEKDLLENNLFSSKNSRLGCQVPLTKEMNGMLIGIPKYQEWLNPNSPNTPSGGEQGLAD